MRSRATRQKGVALISILVIVVIATVLSVTMIRHQNLLIHKVRNQLEFSQARQYALGGEELARQILFEDLRDTQGIDHLGENWAAPEMVFEFEDGEVFIQIIDLQGKINLNEAVLQGDRGQRARARLRALLEYLAVDLAYLDRIVDWMDEDDSVRALGAEDYDYQGGTRPYRAANQPLVERSELRLIWEMSPEAYSQLEPYVATLPTGLTDLNINTADAMTLQSLSPGLSIEVAEQLIAGREEQGGFATVTDFLQSPYLAGLGVQAAGLGVQSAYFEVRVRAHYLDRVGYLTSVIERNPTSGAMRVVHRNLARRVAAIDPACVGTVPGTCGPSL